jgi:hypothetical protein
MFGAARFRWGLLLAALGVITVAAIPTAGREPRAYGERRLAQYHLPPEAVARYAAMAAGAALETVADENSLFADRLPWIGPEQRAGTGHNPYTLVLTVRGMAKADGDVHAQWQAGWQLREAPSASRELLMAVPRIARTGVAAGQPVTLTASSTRVSFRGERSVAPMLGLVQMRNLAVEDVQLEVWSGTAPTPWGELPQPRSLLLSLGLAALLAGLYFRWSSRGARKPAHEPLATPVPLVQPVRASQPAAEPEWRPWPDASDRARPAIMRTDALPAAAVAPAAVSAAAVVAPAPAKPSNEDRVIAALRDLMTFGLTVHTVLDESRGRKKARPDAA